MALSDKLRSLLAIKGQIKTAIKSKGVVVNDDTPFSEYPSKIQSVVAVNPDLGSVEFVVTPTQVTMSKVVFPKSAVVIQTSALLGSNTKEIVLQSGVTTLLANAFYALSNLEKITLPATLTTVGSYALGSNPKLLEIVFNSNIDLNASSYFASYCTKLKKIDLSSCLKTTVAPSGFSMNNPALEDVIFPPSIHTISYDSFRDTPALKVFDFSNITTIWDAAFRNSGILIANLPKATNINAGVFELSAIRSIILPKITGLGTSAISSCSQCKYVELGDAINSIGSYCFRGNNALEAVVIRKTVPPNVSPDSFPVTTNLNFKIYVPDASVTTYKNVSGWSNYTSRIFPISTFVMPNLINLTSFEIIGSLDKTAKVTGKSEAGVTVVLKNPNNITIPLTVNVDGTFSGNIAANAVEGTYTLTVTHPIIGSNTFTKVLTLPTANANPISGLFNSGEKGIYFDLNDLSTMYQDAAGTIPVTAIGQNVGCIKSKYGNFQWKRDTIDNQAKLYKDSVTGANYILNDGIDDAYINNGEIVINSTSLTVFMAARIIGRSSPTSYILQGSPALTISYFNDYLSFTASQAGQYTSFTPNGEIFITQNLPLKMTLTSQYRTKAADTHRLNGYVTTGNTKSIANYTSINTAQSIPSNTTAVHRLYGIAIIDRDATASEITAVETYLTGLMG